MNGLVGRKCEKITSFCRVFKRCTQKNWFLFLLHGANVIADYYLLVNVGYQSVRVRDRERLLRCCCCCRLTWYRFISITRSRLTEKSVQYRFQSSSSPTSLKPNSFDARCTAHAHSVIVGDTTRMRTPTRSLELRYCTPHF